MPRHAEDAKTHSRNVRTRKGTPAESHSAPRGQSGKVRYAVIGCGHIAQAAVLPAFAHAKGNSELAALVTNDKKKLKELGKRYKVDALYDYKGLSRCLAEENIDAVYVRRVGQRENRGRSRYRPSACFA